MSEMVERVAKAIDGQMAEDDNSPDDLARAAIAAMREPTEEMIQSVPNYQYRPAPGRPAAQSIWRGMIDAALKDEPEIALPAKEPQTK